MQGTADEETRYCDACGTEQPVKRTVPWQPDLCRVCGADLEASEE
ncbi:hypothetical protein RBH26_19310 [Natronolimnohabitans sp. A-GB9]|nr:hypothetical protein [Natronolimnohabitans sp. A-GB9]MDQ2052612.1 hypothetical protein [Natronolimnohabitans sp. A-GB9]